MMIRRIFLEAYTKYSEAINIAFSKKYLFYTNVWISMSISISGDLIEQTYELHQKHIQIHNWYRTSTMALSGVIAGCMAHYWYIYLDKILIGKSLETAIQKLMLDQCIFSPIVILAFFASVAIFEDNPIENFNDEVKEKFWTLYKAEWVVWPPAQIINFYFLPLKFRVVYDNIISLGYDIYSSQIKHGKKEIQNHISKNNTK